MATSRQRFQVGLKPFDDTTAFHRTIPFTSEWIKKVATSWRYEATVGDVLGTWENYVFEVRSGHNTAILRITDSSRRTRKEITAELELLMFLHSCGQNVPKISKFAGGEFLLSCENESQSYLACAFEKIPGRQIIARDLLDNTALIQRLGELIGQLHRAVSGFVPLNGGRARWSDNPLLRTENADVLKQEYEDVIDEVLTRMKASVAGPCDFGVVHADLHGRNILITDENKFAIIDFDDSCYHWYCYDLAVPLNWLVHAGGSYDQIRSLLVAGYVREFNFSSVSDFLLDKLVFLRNAMDLKFTLKRIGPEVDRAALARRARNLEHRLLWQIEHLL